MTTVTTSTGGQRQFYKPLKFIGYQLNEQNRLTLKLDDPSIYMVGVKCHRTGTDEENSNGMNRTLKFQSWAQKKIEELEKIPAGTENKFTENYSGTAKYVRIKSENEDYWFTDEFFRGAVLALEERGNWFYRETDQHIEIYYEPVQYTPLQQSMLDYYYNTEVTKGVKINNKNLLFISVDTSGYRLINQNSPRLICDDSNDCAAFLDVTAVQGKLQVLQKRREAKTEKLHDYHSSAPVTHYKVVSHVELTTAKKCTYGEPAHVHAEGKYIQKGNCRLKFNTVSNQWRCRLQHDGKQCNRTAVTHTNLDGELVVVYDYKQKVPKSLYKNK